MLLKRSWTIILESILYGQDVGRSLGGVFREAATLAESLVTTGFSTQLYREAYIVGSTVAYRRLGMKPIVEVQFGDYIYPGINQLVTEVSKLLLLTNGKFRFICYWGFPLVLMAAALP